MLHLLALPPCSGPSAAMSSLLGGIPEGGMVRLDQMAGFFPGADDPLDLRQYVSSADDISEGEGASC